jgi:hypothetical protein
MRLLDRRFGVDVYIDCARVADDSRCRILLLGPREEKICAVADMAVDDVDCRR